MTQKVVFLPIPQNFVAVPRIKLYSIAQDF